MNEYTIHSGKMVPLEKSNIDTDQIIPKQFLKSIKKTGFGPNLFDSWRYLDPGYPGQDNSKRQLNPEFILNKTKYESSDILIAKENFGCGSSREHAVWAIQDYGIRCVIAQSFADIFYSNCFQNGILPIILPESIVTEIMTRSENNPNYQMTIDLEEQKIWDADEDIVTNFDVEPFRKYCMLNGLDDIGLTLEFENNISEFENNRSSYGGII